MNRKKGTLILLMLFLVLGILAFRNLNFSPQFSPFGLASEAEIAGFQKNEALFKKDSAANKGIIVLERKGGWKTYADFQSLEEITNKIKGIPEIIDAQSLTNLDLPQKGIFQFKQISVLDLSSAKRFERTWRILQKRPYVKRKFLSKNDDYTLVFFELGKELTKKSISRIKGLLDHEGEVFIYNGKIQQEDAEADLIQETILISTIALALILISFYLMARSLRGLLWMGGTVLFNLSVTFVFMYLTDISFSMNMITVPCLIVILSFSDLMHIFHHQAKNASLFESDVALRKNMVDKIGWPMILTSLTNMIGFFVFLILSDNTALTELTLVSIFGVGIAYLSSRFFIIPLIDSKHLFIKNRKLDEFGSAFFPIMERLRQKRKRVISILSLFFIGSLFTFYFLFKIDFKVINFVNPKNPSVHVGQIIGEHFFGTKSMEIVISYKKASDKWLYQEQKAIEEIENKIEKVFHPLHLTSSNTLVKRLNSIQINGNPKAYRLLKNLDEKDIEPYLNALGGGAIVSRDGTKSKIKFGFVEDSLEASLAKYKELEMYLKSKSGGQVEYQISGSSVLADRSIYRTTIHIISGLFLALLISAFLILIYYKSIRLAYGALLVNAIPVISCLIFLTILHVQINPQSLFLVSVLAGLCMDDSIYLMGYKSKSLRSIVLFPISATSLVLALAFSSLLFSSYIWLREFSVVFLVGISMAFLLDLFIFPVFMNFISSKND